MEIHRFKGIVQPFPNHFHDYYVIGLIEAGQRTFLCKNQVYPTKKDHILLLNPGDNHACAPCGDSRLDYCALNLPQTVMLEWTETLTGRRELTGFSCHAVVDEEAAGLLRTLHRQLLSANCGLALEETCFFLLSLLLQRYGQPFSSCVPACREEIDKACNFMKAQFAQHICLDQLCRYTGLSKSTLLRAFVKEKGITPYRYLENIRIGAAQKLLEQGVPPVEAALQTGFSDQSHFTNYFSRFIGLSPGLYRQGVSKGEISHEI